MTTPRRCRAPWQVIVPPEVHSYWLDALRRSGVVTRRLDDVDEGVSGASVLCLPDASHLESETLRRRAERLYDRGVPVVAGARAAAALCGMRIQRRSIVGLDGTGPLFALADRIRVEAEIEQLRDATHGAAWPGGEPAVTVFADGRRTMIALPLPGADAVLRAEPRLTAFELPGGRTAQEIVSSCDHGALRRLLCGAIRWAFLRDGLPFLRLGPAPGDALGTFAFRVDADGFDDTATRALVDDLDDAGISATWFLDVERHARHGGGIWVSRLREHGHEVQTHGYRHYTYASEARNRHNFARSLAVLAQWGTRATAAAAPFGTWNPGLQRSYAALGLRYSSEFSRLYDDHPGVLATPASSPALWQVPIHPICPALLTGAGLSAAEVSRYFAGVLRQRLARGEPAVLYGHPIGDLQGVRQLLPELARMLAETEARANASIWRPTLTELFAFYAARSTQQPKCHVGSAGLTIHNDGPAPLWVDTPGGRCVRVAEHRALSAGELHEPEDRDDSSDDGGPNHAVLVPRPWTARSRHRLALRGQRLRLARLWREVRTNLRHGQPVR